jgi:hypothetical protein
MNAEALGIRRSLSSRAEVWPRLALLYAQRRRPWLDGCRNHPDALGTRSRRNQKATGTGHLDCKREVSGTRIRGKSRRLRGTATAADAPPPSAISEDRIEQTTVNRGNVKMEYECGRKLASVSASVSCPCLVCDIGSALASGHVDYSSAVFFQPSPPLLSPSSLSIHPILSLLSSQSSRSALPPFNLPFLHRSNAPSAVGRRHRRSLCLR